MFHWLLHWPHWLLHRLHWLCLALVLIPSAAHAVPWVERCDSSECRLRRAEPQVAAPSQPAAYTPPPAPPVETEDDGTSVLIVAAVAAGAALGLSRTRHYI